MLGYGGDGSLNGALLPGDSLQKQQREEALKATVVLNLLADRGRESFPDVIVQMPYRLPEKQDLVGHALRLTTGNMHVSDRPSDELLHGETFRVMDAQRPYVQVHGSENTGKISAFAAFQPGTSRIFEELFKQSEDTPEFYLSHAPQFVGKTFGEGKYFPITTFPRLIAHTRLTLSFLSYQLSTKVLDTAEKLEATLLHEMCHAAAWLLDQVWPPGISQIQAPTFV